jgi:hypothetical protein
MSANKSEYLESEQSNKADPQPGQKPETNLGALVPQLRMTARRSRLISDGAKVLYDDLTDLSFLDSVSPFRGVVDMAKAKFAREFGLDPATIRRRANELESTGFIWTRTYWEGAIEITRWFIRGLANVQMELYRDYPNPSYGSSKTMARKERPQPPRNRHGQFCPHGESREESAESPRKSASIGQDCPEPSDKIARSQRAELPVANGHIYPLATDISARSHRAELPVANGQNCPTAMDNSVRSPRAEVPEHRSLETVTESGESSKRLSNRAGRAPGNGTGLNLTAREKESENDFLAHCEQVLGRREMEGNGGGWRIYFRINKAKAWACLQETRSMATEGRIKTTPAKTMMDLWKNDRLAYDRQAVAR